MKITRRFTKSGQDVLASIEYERRTSRISNPDGSLVFEMKNAEIPRSWSQLATDIMVSKYFRKAGVPQTDSDGNPLRDEKGNILTGPERSARQVIHRLAGCWRQWGEQHNYFDSADDAQAFYDELAYMLLNQMCAPNSPQWFNTGLNFAYNITGPAQGHFYCDPANGELKESADAYSHPQPHACFIQAVSDDLVNPGGIMDLWTREARLFKYGSGTGSNFSALRGENEALSGGGKSSGLMSFLKIGDRAAGAIKSGGTTRRAAKMCCLDLDHPDVESFISWKVREELKVAAMVEGLRVLPKDQQDLAKKFGLKLDYDFNGEAYFTVSGQNSNNSVRIPNAFFKSLEEDGDWTLIRRTDGKPAKTIKARDLWEQIAFAAWRCADPGVQFDSTINEWHTCPTSGRINASNPCVTGDTRVLMPGGIWRRIDQMIHLPARVITNLDGQEIHPTEGAFPTGMREVYELRTTSGYRLKLTGDHKVWTKNRGWIAASALETSDEIKLPSRPACVESIGDPQDPAFFQLVGLYLSDASNDAAALHLGNALQCAPELADGFAAYVAEKWEHRLYPDDYVNQLMDDDGDDRTSHDSSAGNTMTLSLTNRRLLSRMAGFIRTEAGRRRLSDDAFTAGLPAQRHLLRGLFTADATLQRESLTLRLRNPGLIEDVQTILLGFGVKSAAGAGDDTGPATLTIDGENLIAFARHVGLLHGAAAEQLEGLVERHPQRTSNSQGNYDRVASLIPQGQRQVFDLTEPVTSSFVANGLTVHNCSEYMFLDDTACNLASLNVLTFFDSDSRRFDVEAFKHATRIWTIVLEISVLMASFPSESIAKLSFRYRTLGLGYANLGAMLMQSGIPYDCEKGRAICAAITAILTGESYAASAELAAELGTFPGYADNTNEMLRVIRNHRRAAYDVDRDASGHRRVGTYENLETHPVGIDATQFSDGETLATRGLLHAAQECWDRALSLGEKHGYRNAQTTVIAPTGTIGLLMDCDTTGVEPDFALVKFKKLAGGGYFKIANQSLRPALVNLGYDSHQIHDILRYVMGTLSLEDSPHINLASLRKAGLNDDDLQTIEANLPSVFEIGFAFKPWTLGAETMQRLGYAESQWQESNFNLLTELGFSRRQIGEANDIVCGRGTVEGAPHLKAEHLPVFDCANKCGKTGQRFIAVEGHIRMMAAAQPFISGAISKTINLPNEANIQDIKSAYFLSWKLGLKANALYRDGSKLSQPLNVKSDEDLENKTDEQSADDIHAAREEVAADVALAASIAPNVASQPAPVRSDNLTAAPMIERIIERIVERPLRRRLPDTRRALTHKFDVAGHEGYITVGLYEDGAPGEVFITMAKEGSTIGGLMDTIATLVSVALQYGVPVESLVRKFEHVRFEPSGMTRNAEIPFAKSLVDYIFRWLAMEFIPGYRLANAPTRPEKKPSPPAAKPDATVAETADQIRPIVPPVVKPRKEAAGGGNGNGNGNGHNKSNGHGPRVETDGAKPFEYADEPLLRPRDAGSPDADASPSGLTLRAVVVADPLSQQGTEMQSDAPACDVCGSITVRSGTCYKCLNCGNSMGCS